MPARGAFPQGPPEDRVPRARRIAGPAATDPCASSSAARARLGGCVETSPSEPGAPAGPTMDRCTVPGWRSTAASSVRAAAAEMRRGGQVNSTGLRALSSGLAFAGAADRGRHEHRQRGGRPERTVATPPGHRTGLRRHRDRAGERRRPGPASQAPSDPREPPGGDGYRHERADPGPFAGLRRRAGPAPTIVPTDAGASEAGTASAGAPSSRASTARAPSCPASAETGGAVGVGARRVRADAACRAEATPSPNEGPERNAGSGPVATGRRRSAFIHRAAPVGTGRRPDARGGCARGDAPHPPVRVGVANGPTLPRAPIGALSTRATSSPASETYAWRPSPRGRGDPPASIFERWELAVRIVTPASAAASPLTFRALPLIGAHSMSGRAGSPIHAATWAMSGPPFAFRSWSNHSRRSTPWRDRRRPGKGLGHAQLRDP